METSIIGILEMQIEETKTQLEYFNKSLNQIKSAIDEHLDIDVKNLTISDLEKIAINLLRANYKHLSYIYTKLEIKANRRQTNVFKKHQIRHLLRQIPLGVVEIAKIMNCDHSTIINSSKVHSNFRDTQDRMYMYLYNDTLIELITIINNIHKENK